MLSNKKYVLPAITFCIGVLLGQVSIITAFNPIRFVKDSADLAANAYRYGCTKHGGIDCLNEAVEYEKILLDGLNSPNYRKF